MSNLKAESQFAISNSVIVKRIERALLQGRTQDCLWGREEGRGFGDMGNLLSPEKGVLLRYIAKQEHFVFCFLSCAPVHIKHVAFKDGPSYINKKKQVKCEVLQSSFTDASDGRFRLSFH